MFSATTSRSTAPSLTKKPTPTGVLTILHLRKASPAPTFVTMPVDKRALAVARGVLNNPGQANTLEALCSHAGASVRTMQRMFRKDLGTDFESWRRQVRMTKAVELLVSGCSVKEAAFAVGYRQPSAFVYAFRRTFGAAPKAWAAALRQLP